MCDIQKVIRWLANTTQAGVWQILKRLGFSYKYALHFVRSPDPNYRYKRQRILAAYQEVIAKPNEVVMLFQDEFTYYRRAHVHKCYQLQGKNQQRHHHQAGWDNKARIVATLDAVTGQVCYRQRSRIDRWQLCAFYQDIRQQHYPSAQRIYLVEDNWSVHYHPQVLQAAEQNKLTLLFLPTYSSWLNPIEKMWRWLRQDVLHNHRQSHDFKQLRTLVTNWLDQFALGSHQLLHYVGLLSKKELDSIPVLNC